MGAYIRWGEHEVLAVLQEARRISERLTEQGGRIDDWKAVAEAQKLVLPPERRRLIAHASHAAVVIAAWRGITVQDARAPRKARAARRTGAAAPAETSPPPAPAAPLQRDVAVGVLAAVVEEFAVCVIKRVLTNPDIAAALNSLFHRQLPDFVVASSPPPSTPQAQEHEKVALPVVLVCGIRSHVYDQLQHAVAGRLRLKFWYDGGQGGGAGLAALKEKAGQARACVFAMGESSHAHVRTAEAVCGRVLRATGKNSQMVTVLRALADKLSPGHV